MPRGVESRRRPEYPMSYYELRDVTVDNIDRNIELAKQAGLKTMVVYYVDFAKACGHYEWRDEYPRGMADLQEITRKITDAGMIPGIHIQTTARPTVVAMWWHVSLCHSLLTRHRLQSWSRSVLKR